MKLFVWNYLIGLTDNYHDGGGLVIIAEDLVEANLLVTSETEFNEVLPLPDLTRECEGPVYIKVHADAGCC